MQDIGEMELPFLIKGRPWNGLTVGEKSCYIIFCSRLPPYVKRKWTDTSWVSWMGGPQKKWPPFGWKSYFCQVLPFFRESKKKSTECRLLFSRSEKSSARLKWLKSRFILCKSWYNGQLDVLKFLDLTKIVPEFTSQLHILWNIRLSSVFASVRFSGNRKKMTQ